MEFGREALTTVAPLTRGVDRSGGSVGRLKILRKSHVLGPKNVDVFSLLVSSLNAKPKSQM